MTLSMETPGRLNRCPWRSKSSMEFNIISFTVGFIAKLIRSRQLPFVDGDACCTCRLVFLSKVLLLCHIDSLPLTLSFMLTPANHLLFACLVSCTATVVQAQPQLGKNPVGEVVSAMSLEEKVNILVGG